MSVADCLFCKIISGAIAAEIIYENSSTKAFLDIHPCAPGHTLVVPNIHAETILDLQDQSGEGLFKAVKQATKKLKIALNPDGFTIGINHGAAAGQAIPHLHVHIIPRFKNDGGGTLHTVVNQPATESISETANRIRSANGEDLL